MKRISGRSGRMLLPLLAAAFACTLAPSSTETAAPEDTRTSSPTITPALMTAVLNETPTGTPVVLPESRFQKDNISQLAPVGILPIGQVFSWANTEDLMAVGKGSTLNVYFLGEGRLDLRGSLKHSWTISAIAFSPDDRWLALGDDGYHAIIRILDRASLTDRCVIENAGNNGIGALDFSPDGRWLASGDNHGGAVLWETESCQLVRAFPEYRPDYIHAIDFHPSGNWVAFAGEGPYLCPVPDGECFYLDESLPYATDVRFHPDGSILAAITPSHSRVTLFSALDWSPAESFDLRKTGLFSVDFTCDGKMMMTTRGGDVTVLDFLDSSSGALLFEYPVQLPIWKPDFNQGCSMVAGWGKPDRITLLALTEDVDAFQRDLRFDDASPYFGRDVWLVQTRLLELGYTYLIEVDGLFGEKTKISVQQFQAKNDLAQDGVVGEVTWKVLFGSHALRADQEPG